MIATCDREINVKQFICAKYWIS